MIPQKGLGSKIDRESETWLAGCGAFNGPPTPPKRVSASGTLPALLFPAPPQILTQFGVLWGSQRINLAAQHFLADGVLPVTKASSTV